MIEALHLLTDKDQARRYARFIEPHLNSPEAETFFTDALAYWEFSTRWDWSEFTSWFFVTRHPTMPKDKQANMRTLFDNIASTEPDSEVMSTIIKSLMARSYATEIAVEAVNIQNTGGDLDTLDSILREYKEESGQVGDLMAKLTTDYLKVYTDDALHEGWKWKLPTIQAALGNIRRGNLVVIGARPDSGKTSFLAANINYFMEQMGDNPDPVLFVANEESPRALLNRFIANQLGVSISLVDSDPSTYVPMYPHKLEIYHDSGINVRDIEVMIDERKPSVIVFDQLRKVKGFERESGHSEPQRQELLFCWARSLAITHAPVMVVHQADGTADGEAYIGMSQFHMNKTGLQGEADAIITIGRKYADASGDKRRYIFIPKNKMLGEEPAYRNARFEVDLHGDTGTWVEL